MSLGLALAVLIVTAHPDDEYCMAATTARLSHELGARVDQVVVTNGEGGYKYSTPAETYYGKPLVKEEAGRKELPSIRAKELEGAGKILGIREHELLEQKDFGYTLDLKQTFSKWDREKVLEKLKQRMSRNSYDFVLVLLPTAKEHAHHRAASLLALEAANALPEEKRPVALGCWDSSEEPRSDDQKAAIEEAQSYTEVQGYPLSKRASGIPELKFDRRRPFGFQNKLNYHVWVNWMIAEHKSQGLFQMMVGQDDVEHFAVLGVTGGIDAAKRKVLGLLAAVNGP